MPMCSVPMCKDRGPSHKFPRDKVMRKNWLIAIKRADPFHRNRLKLWTSGTAARICRGHFTPEDYSAYRKGTMFLIFTANIII